LNEKHCLSHRENTSNINRNCKDIQKIFELHEDLRKEIEQKMIANKRFFISILVTIMISAGGQWAYFEKRFSDLYQNNVIISSDALAQSDTTSGQYVID